MTSDPWPRRIRLAAVALATLILCSCQSLRPATQHGHVQNRFDQSEYAQQNRRPNQYAQRPPAQGHQATALRSGDPPVRQAGFSQRSQEGNPHSYAMQAEPPLPYARPANENKIAAGELRHPASMQPQSAPSERQPVREQRQPVQEADVARTEIPRPPYTRVALPGTAAPLGTGTLPARAWTGGPPPGSAQVPPQTSDRPWRPPGIGGTWPKDEYLHDGGDYILPAHVREDWTVIGLEQEDAVAHYDTLDDRTIVVPSNRVHLYAPRFGVVRRVDNLRATEAQQRLAGIEYPMKLNLHEETQLATTAIQPLQPQGQVGADSSSLYRTLQKGGEVETRNGLAGMFGRFAPFEDLSLIRRGIMDQADKARLAKAAKAAIVWTNKQAVQVILDGRKAQEITEDQQVQTFYRFDKERGPELRLIKVASTETALPGDTVDFTLRFDNTGREPIGNVVILDNLATRLEYLPDTQQCSLPHQFQLQPNEGGSHILRWQLEEPLEPGSGGIIRFRCVVR